MQIILNDAAYDCAPSSTLAQLLTQLDLPNQAMAVAVNRRVIRRADWPSCVLNEHDRVDIVRAIGGG